MAVLLGRTAKGLISRCSNACGAATAQIRMARAAHISRQQVGRPPRAAAGDFVDDVIDWTEDMPVPVKRRVAALREVQKDYDNLMQQFVKERAELLAKYQKQAEPLLDKRESVVAGKAEVGSYDIPDSLPDEGPDEGIPDFWLTAIVNHDMVGEYVKEQDAKVLSYLSDVRVEHLTGEDAGSFKLVFSFSENPFFTSKVLEKTFYMEDPDEIVPEKFVGCSIDWLPGKDTTVTTVKKKVSDKKGGKGAKVTVSQQKPCDSFFNFFKTPVMPENPDDLSEKELEDLQQQMDEDYEIAIAFKESIVPRAVEWFTGEACPPMYDDDYELGEYGDEYEDEPLDVAPKRR